jgi:integrase
MSEPLLIRSEKGSAVRVFTPAEVDALVGAIKQPHHRTLFNVLLWTGMRYVEVQRLHEHPEYVLQTRGYIDLPFDAARKKKGKRTPPQRQVPIPQQLAGELPYFFRNPAPPTVQVWGRNLKRWAVAAGIGNEGVSPKSTRKTIESWMVVIDMPMNKVCLRQGHDSATSLGYYQNMAFTYDEVAEIKRRLASWV